MALVRLCMLPLMVLASSLAWAQTDGSLDPAFGNAGQLLFARDPGEGNPSAALGELAALPDGAVQAALRSRDELFIQVLRLDAHGIPDPGFGTEGRVELRTCAGARDVAIATTTDAGALIWTGECLIKLNAAGALDPAFGEQGMVSVGVGPVVMTQDPNGRVLLAGLDAAGLYVRRYLADGSLDASFGEAGIAHLNYAVGQFPELHALVVGRDGAITAGGLYYADFVRDVLLLRLRGDGSPETDFGEAGVAILPPPEGYFISADALVPLADGGLLFSGPASNGISGCCTMLGRVAADGELDPAFGLKLFQPGGGLRVGSFFEERRVLALLPSGRILLGLTAWASLDHRSDYTLMRFLADGSIDTSFGEFGWRAYDMPDLTGQGQTASYDQLHDFVVVDGRVTLFGRTFFEDNSTGDDYLAFTRVALDDLFADDFER